MLATKLLGVPQSNVLPIQYVGGYTTGFTGSSSDITITFGGNLTGGLASSADADDLVIVYFGTGSGRAVDRNLVVSGYIEIADLFSDDDSATNLAVAYKFMGPTPDTNFVLTGGTFSSNDAGVVAVQVWRNVNNSPLDISPTTATGTNSILCNPPAITAISPGAYIVSGGAGGHNSGTQTFSSSDLTGFISSGGNSGNDITIGLGYKQWISGSIDPAQFTFSTSNATRNSWAAVTIALKPKTAINYPEFIASAQTQNTTIGNTLVINKPSETIQGDLMIAFMSSGGTATSRTWTTPSGWTELVDQNIPPNFLVAYKVAGASEGTNYTFTMSSTANDKAGTILTYRNAAYDVIGALSTNNSTLTLSSVTASSANSTLIAALFRPSGSITITQSAGSTMTIKVTDNDVNSPSFRVFDESVSSGATGTRSFSMGGSTATVGTMLIIKPN